MSASLNPELRDRPVTSTEAEIEITPEMIEAGAAVIADFFERPCDWLMCDLTKRVLEATLSRDLSQWNASS